MATINDLPQKGGLKATMLWNNPSPQTNFAQQTITLSGSLADYKYIRIGYKFDKNSDDSEINIYYVDFDLFNKHRYTASEPMRYSMTEYVAAGSLGYVTRYLYYADTTYTKITVSNCYKINGSGTNNINLVPRRIYGLK